MAATVTGVPHDEITAVHSGIAPGLVVTQREEISEQYPNFANESLPSTSEAWLQRARQVSGILAHDAAARDIANKSPRAEIQLLKSSGLLKILGPLEIGGGGQTWETGFQVIREVAKGDGSIGMLLGYHLLWSTTANIVGTDEQKARIQQLIIENNYFVGGENKSLQERGCIC